MKSDAFRLSWLRNCDPVSRRKKCSSGSLSFPGLEAMTHYCACATSVGLTPTLQKYLVFLKMWHQNPPSSRFYKNPRDTP
ncbi:hypothetical protein PoB_000069600 [Plakobranchus ocellatus]|uniref:Uncharacterized protein n=1 Tax=Plakobranchus ocellatus TaxID=259542 RepID=A0AAV3XTK2_9GAST|nr:hypothetical protein PoB_000069600 [Plakobranchus ocellatus]